MLLVWVYSYSYAKGIWHIYYNVERSEAGVRLLSVGLTGVAHDVTAQLQQDCVSLLHEGFRIAVDEICKGKYTFIGCNIVEGELSFRNYERVKDSLKNYVAKNIADFILNREEEKLIRHLIERNYNYFTQEEQEKIFDNSLKLLGNTTSLLHNFSALERRNRIITRLIDYLDTHHELVVDGFIQFRLKDYREGLAQIVDKAVDDLMMDLEYKEFIRVLRYFVNVKDSQVEEVHVIIQGANSFRIIDSGGKTINNQHLDNFAAQYVDEISYEDLLISALITISPHYVVLHNPESKGNIGMVETVKGVFEDRVMMCSSCNLCQESMANMPFIVDID